MADPAPVPCTAGPGNSSSRLARHFRGRVGCGGETWSGVVSQRTTTATVSWRSAQSKQYHAPAGSGQGSRGDPAGRARSRSPAMCVPSVGVGSTAGGSMARPSALPGVHSTAHIVRDSSPRRPGPRSATRGVRAFPAPLASSLPACTRSRALGVLVFDDAARPEVACAGSRAASYVAPCALTRCRRTRRRGGGARGGGVDAVRGAADGLAPPAPAAPVGDQAGRRRRAVPARYGRRWRGSCARSSMATRSGTFARIRLRAAVRRQSWRKRVGTPAD